MRSGTDNAPEFPRSTGVVADPPGFSIRPARPEDAEMLVNLVLELAVYEKLEQHALATADDFRRHLFGPNPAAEAAVAEVGAEPVGFALWFSTFSTFRGQPGLYLEDIFVKPIYRGQRDRQRAVSRSGQAGRRAWVRTAGMVGARLEHPRHRILPGARCTTNGRVDCLQNR